MPASAQCAGTLAGRCSGWSDPQPRAGQRTMPGVLPNGRLLPTPFKNVSTNLHVSKLPSSVRLQTPTQPAPQDCDSLPTLPTYHHGWTVHVPSLSNDNPNAAGRQCSWMNICKLRSCTMWVGGGGKEAAVGWLHRESCVGGGERGTYVGDGVL